MQVTETHLQDFLKRWVFRRTHRVVLQCRSDSVAIRLSAEGPREVGAQELQMLDRIFESRNFHIPAWQVLSEGCDTCGDGSIAELDFILISDAAPLSTAIANAALLRWELELDEQERQRQMELLRRRQERENERRRQRSLAEQKAQRKLKTEIDLLFKYKLDDVFELLWDIYQPLLGMPGRDYYEHTQGLPKNVAWLLRPINKAKPQTKEACKEAFMRECGRAPKKMRKTLFPEGKMIELNYRCVRKQRDSVMRAQERKFRAEGFKVF